MIRESPAARGGRRLRVAQVVVTDRFAGTERYAATVATELAARGLDVTVIGGHQDRMRTVIGRGRGRVSFHPAPDLPAAVATLRRRAPFDVVHVHLTAGELAATLAFPRRSAAVIVSTRHIAARRGKTPMGAAAAHLIRRRVDLQVAPSRFIASTIDGAATLIPTGVAGELLGSHDQRVVLVAQRLDPEKDTATALRAWAQAGLADDGWQLHVAGGGVEEADLRRLSVRLGIAATVHFLGHVDDIGSRMAGAGILLATAPGEAFGLSVVEAMARGTAVVATGAGGHLETVGALDRARLFAPRDHSGAARHLRDLACDETERRSYGSALRSLQRTDLDLHRFIDRVLECYKGLLDRPAPGHGTKR